MKKIVIACCCLLQLQSFGTVPMDTTFCTEVQTLKEESWKKRISSGDEFKAVLDKTVGTLAEQEVYLVRYLDGGFETTGYNLYYEGEHTQTYSNANPKHEEISLWGAVFKFNEEGELFYKGEKIGRIFL